MNRGSKLGWDMANSTTTADCGWGRQKCESTPVNAAKVIAANSVSKEGKNANPALLITCHGHWKPSNDGSMRIRMRTRNLVLMDNHSPDQGGDLVAQVLFFNSSALVVLRWCACGATVVGQWCKSTLMIL